MPEVPEPEVVEVTPDEAESLHEPVVKSIAAYDPSMSHAGIVALFLSAPDARSGVEYPQYRGGPKTILPAAFTNFINK